MPQRSRIPRIVSAVVQRGRLHATLDDGTSVSVPLKLVSPQTGKADWSQITLEFHGAHLVVPVAGGEYPEHEVPSDVLKRFAIMHGDKPARQRKTPKVALS